MQGERCWLDVWGKLVVCWIACSELWMRKTDDQTTFFHPSFLSPSSSCACVTEVAQFFSSLLQFLSLCFQAANVLSLVPSVFVAPSLLSLPFSDMPQSNRSEQSSSSYVPTPAAFSGSAYISCSARCSSDSFLIIAYISSGFPLHGRDVNSLYPSPEVATCIPVLPAPNGFLDSRFIRNHSHWTTCTESTILSASFRPSSSS